LMAPAPALAVTLKAGFIAYDAYYTATELYGEIGGLFGAWEDVSVNT
jgi:hypothetical protein